MRGRIGQSDTGFALGATFLHPTAGFPWVIHKVLLISKKFYWRPALTSFSDDANPDGATTDGATTDGSAGKTRPETPALPRIGRLIRERRKAARKTLQALCDDAGLSVGYLSQIERDQAVPALSTLAQIARSLGVGVEYFITTPTAQEALSRAEGRPRFHIEGSSVIYEKLSSEFAGSQMSAYLLQLPAGYRSEVFSHEGEEFITILEGCVTLWLDGDKMVMGPGDALHFHGSRQHAWHNHTGALTRMLWTGRLSLLQTGALPRSDTGEPQNQPQPQRLSPETAQCSKPDAEPDQKPARKSKVQRRDPL